MLSRDQQPQGGNPPTPNCPHCKAKMPNISWNTMAPQAGAPGGPPLALLVFFCPQCKMVLNCQFMGLTSVLPPEKVSQIHQVLAAQIERPRG